MFKQQLQRICTNPFNHTLFKYFIIYFILIIFENSKPNFRLILTEAKTTNFELNSKECSDMHKLNFLNTKTIYEKNIYCFKYSFFYSIIKQIYEDKHLPLKLFDHYKHLLYTIYDNSNLLKSLGSTYTYLKICEEQFKISTISQQNIKKYRQISIQLDRIQNFLQFNICLLANLFLFQFQDRPLSRDLKCGIPFIHNKYFRFPELILSIIDFNLDPFEMIIYLFQHFMLNYNPDDGERYTSPVLVQEQEQGQEQGQGPIIKQKDKTLTQTKLLQIFQYYKQEQFEDIDFHSIHSIRYPENISLEQFEEYYRYIKNFITLESSFFKIFEMLSLNEAYLHRDEEVFNPSYTISQQDISKMSPDVIQKLSQFFQEKLRMFRIYYFRHVLINLSNFEDLFDKTNKRIIPILLKFYENPTRSQGQQIDIVSASLLKLERHDLDDSIKKLLEKNHKYIKVNYTFSKDNSTEYNYQSINDMLKIIITEHWKEYLQDIYRILNEMNGLCINDTDLLTLSRHCQLLITDEMVMFNIEPYIPLIIR
jgi:hypothetical protein